MIILIFNFFIILQSGIQFNIMRNNVDLYKYDSKTSENITEEPWYYRHFQPICEVMSRGYEPFGKSHKFFEESPTGKDDAFLAVKKYFEEFGDGTDDNRIRNWIECCWLTSEQIQAIRILE